MLRLGLCLVASALLASACSGEPEPTIEERLSELAGRTLSSVEVAEQLETADAVCQLDDQLLFRLWAKLDDEQFAFQEIAFNHHCPDRQDLIARFVPPRTTTSTTIIGGSGSEVTGEQQSTSSTTTSSPSDSVTSTTARFGAPEPSAPTTVATPSTQVGEGG